MEPIKFLIALSLLVFHNSYSQSGTDKIQLNQIGFYSLSPKIAVVTTKTNAEKFYVLTPNLKDTVYRGVLSAQKQSQYSTTITRTADFSTLIKKGRYLIAVPGVGNSYSFQIDDAVFSDVSKALLKAFYFMRSDMPLDRTYAGKWSRPPGHADTVVLIHASAASGLRPAGTIISVPKGWYDAGDYNKYIVNSGITMGTLLSAYEDFPNYFERLRINIPESGDALPDVLNEVLYNLRWMLSMQDPNDGGVYHKCTNAAFDGMIMPALANAPRYVVQKSTAATLDFAAVMAQAARVFKNFARQLPFLSDSCLNAAIKAWHWAEKNPSVLYDQREINLKYHPEITTGEYGDRNVKDEWLWAACELYATTKNENYYLVVKERMKDAVPLPSWGNVAMLGYYTLIRFEKNLPFAHDDIASMKDTVLNRANIYLVNEKTNAFTTVMGQTVRDFIWGSNAVAANQGILLINAYLISKDKKYIRAALANADYLLGRNATGYCFITGEGTKSPMHPHHRPSVADGITQPVPGLLVGGPNPGRQDKCPYPLTDAETSYVDSDCAYASNEIAINWNAPAVYLLNALQVLIGKK